MNKKITLQFTVLTFCIMLISWGLCIVCGNFGMTLNSHPLLYLPFLLGGLSPTIASYAVLKKNNKVLGLKQWLKNVFNFKSRPVYYLLTIFLFLLFFIPQILISGLIETNPVYMFFVMLPAMLVGGGMEEAGWRYILQPELDKKYGFTMSSIFVGVIWSLWHLPLFFIPGVGQYGTNFGLFAITIFAASFSYGAIRKVSGSVFLCVLAHSMANAGFNTFIFNQSFLSSTITTGLVIIVSIAIVVIDKKKNVKRINNN